MSTTTSPRATTVIAPWAAASRRVRGRRRRTLGKVWYNALGLIAAVLAVFPVYWMVNNAFLPGRDIRSDTPTFLPFGGNLDNFRRVFDEGNFLDALRISMSVTLLTVVAALLFGFLAALAVSRFRFRGHHSVVLIILMVQMIPAEGLFISQFKMLEGWNLLNSVFGLSLLYTASVAPFMIWLLRGFVDGVPAELEEAAMVDGCTRTGAFFRITLPLLAPGLVATGIFAFLQAWNEFTVALVIMVRPENQTLPVWIRTFIDVNRTTDWGGIMAGATLIAIPVVIFFLFVQRRMAAGVVTGAVKG